MKFGLALIRRSNGSTTRIGKPCNSWTDEHCAKRKAERILRHADLVLASARRVWSVSVTDEPRVRERLKQRRRMQFGCFLSVLRVDGVRYVFATVDLGGRTPPIAGEWLSNDEAFALLLNEVLALPGVASCSWSRGWQPSPERSTGLYYGLDAGTKDVWDRGVLIAQLKAQTRFGVIPELEQPLPRAISPEAWEEILRESLEEARSELDRLRDEVRVDERQITDTPRGVVTDLPLTPSPNAQTVISYGQTVIGPDPTPPPPGPAPRPGAPDAGHGNSVIRPPAPPDGDGGAA